MARVEMCANIADIAHTLANIEPNPHIQDSHSRLVCIDLGVKHITTFHAV